MSEFRVIKCKKCNAALIELEGEKLTHCIQCGYQFGGIEKKSNSTFHARLDQIREVKESKAPIISNSSRSTGSTRTNKTSKKQLPAPSKRKAPIWFTIVKWYIIISVVIGIISGIFR